MAIIKVTFFFEACPKGWTESWWVDRPDANLRNAYAQSLDVAGKRANLLGEGAVLKAIRVSSESLNNDSYLIYVNLTPNPIGTDEFAPDLADLDIAVLTVAHGDDYRKRKHTFLRGFWDSIEVNGGKFDGPNKAAWVMRFNNWATALKTAEYGWIGTESRLTSDLTGYTVDAQNRVVFTLKDDLFLAPDFGEKTNIRIGFLPCNNSLNGVHVVTITSANSVTTYKPTPAIPYTTGGKFTISEYGFIELEEMGPQKIVPRKSGAPLLVTPGRR